ncbi:MAG: DUF4148 domain-containing protein [Ramlibacter sp.]
MNRNFSLALASACLAAAPAFAGEIGDEPPPFVSTLTRAQVMEELSQFRHAGVNPWANDYDQLAQMHSTSTRAAVRADYFAARSTAAAFNGEDSGSAYLARMAAAKPRLANTELARSE